MNRKVKLGSIAFVLAALIALLVIMASDRVFFMNLKLRADDTVYDVADGYELYFFKDKTELHVATLFHNVEPLEGDMIPVLVTLQHPGHYQIDSMKMEFDTVYPPSALKSENPWTGQPITFVHTRTDTESSATIDIPDLGAAGSDNVTFNFWLNPEEREPIGADELILKVTFTMHEESLLKIARYNGTIAVRMEMPLLP